MGQPASPADPKRLAKAIADLDSEQFSVREKALQELEQFVDEIAPTLKRKLAEETNSLEVRRRIERVLEKLDKSAIPSPEELRYIRAVQVLELIGAPEAKELLKSLANGTEGARKTMEAKASLERLTRRSAINP